MSAKFRSRNKNKLKMNKSFKILLPLLLAIAVAFGIFLGSKIQQRITPKSTHPMSLFQPDKLSLFIKLIERDYVDTVNTSEIIEKTIPKILEDLDPHTTYIPAREMKAVSEEMRGNFSGIGVQFVMENDTVMIVDVVSGGPSQPLGVLAGDRIVKVDGRNVAGVELPSDSIVGMLRGEKGTKVLVSIFRPSVSEVIDFEIERGDVPLYSIDASYMITDSIGFIKVDRFAETTYHEFVDAIKKLQSEGASKLIIDLRANSGGYLELVYQMVDEFLPANSMIVYTQGKSRQRSNYYATERGIWEDKEVLVIIDEFSASASEIFAGAIQDNDRGLVVGRRSFGKGLVQEQIPFFDGSALRLTVSRFYTPSGRSIQKPYDKGNREYQMDYHNRMLNNELSEKDSIHFNDSLRYFTKGGRVVYGGGGIMPDIFVPVDTFGINNLYTSIARRNLIYRFAFEYADRHRAEFTQLESVKALDRYLKQVDVLTEFLNHAKANDIAVKKQELQESRALIQTQLHAYICRNIFGDEAFYPVFLKIDKTVQKAIEALESASWNTKSVAQLQVPIQEN